MNISVTYNVNTLTRELAGKTVGELRSMFAGGLDIPGDAVAKIGAEEVGPDRVVMAGESLVFVKKAGDKGGC